MSGQMVAPDRLQVVMGTAGVRLWSAGNPLPAWAKDVVVTEYVRADAMMLAAPDLYAALKQAAGWMRDMITAVGVDDDDNGLLAIIDAALSSASPSLAGGGE